MQQFITDPQTHQYDFNQFALTKALRAALSIEGTCLLDRESASDSDLLQLVKPKAQQLRRQAMEELQGSDFQKILSEFSSYLADAHFNEDCYFQKVPSIRLFMPDALGTSWHTDSWYGHSKLSRTFWVPLTEVPKGAGVQFIYDDTVLTDLENRLGKSLSLADINRVCAEHAEEVTAQPGEYLSFSGRTLHGSVKNSSGVFRCSLDFRGTTVTNGLGNKPLNNYRLIENGEAKEACQPFEQLTAVKYINGATGASTKYQHILLEAYAADKALEIVRNEAEIESVQQWPVLNAYADRNVPMPNNYEHVLVYSMQCLPKSHNAAIEVLESCERRGIQLHFALEDVIFPTTADIATCLQSNQSIVA